VSVARWSHSFPFRTRKLNASAPKILGFIGLGK